MWILKFLPDWIFYAVFLLGVIGLAATYLLKLIPIPFLYVYKTPIQLISIACIAIGVYMAGAIANEDAWNARVAELQIRVAEAEAKSTQVNTEVVEKVVNRTQVVKEKGDEVIKYVETEVVKYDTKFLPGGQCEIPKEFIIALNKAALP
jgi:hypothetical protein